VAEHTSKQAQQSTLAPPTTQIQTRPFAPVNSQETTQVETRSEKLARLDPQERLYVSAQAFSQPSEPNNFYGSSQSLMQRKWEGVIQRYKQKQANASSTANPIQAKLAIGAVGDKYEQEADQVAAQVVQKINLPENVQRHEEEEIQAKSFGSIQRHEEDEELQMKPLSESIQRVEEGLQMSSILQRHGGGDHEHDEELQMSPTLQRREAGGGGDASEELENSIQQARGGGQSLDPNLQAKMGQAMGADFSGVKVHTDSQSDQLNQSIQAKAFTTGQDVFFRQGAYSPSSKDGQELIAHELTHVVQQNGGAVQRSALAKGKSGIHSTTGYKAASSVIQRSYGTLNPMSKARVDQKSEEKYAEKAQEFEFKMSPKIMADGYVNANVDMLISRVRKIVNAWADSTGKDLAKTYEQEFGWPPGDDYYGAFEMTAVNISKALYDKNQPMRTKLKVVYNAVRNNNLAKWLKLAAIELDRKAKKKTPKDWKIKSATQSVKSGGKIVKGRAEKQTVKTGFAEKSGLSSSLTPKQVSELVATAKTTEHDKSKRDLFGHDMFSSSMNFEAQNAKANKQRRPGASNNLSLTEQRTLSAGEVPDLTDAEIDLLYKKQNKPKPDKPERDRFRNDPSAKIAWSQGGEFFDIELGSESAKAANDVKARMEAGISGSTDLMLHAAQYLGMTDLSLLKGLRLALAGWMMANRDHSFYEVYKAAESYGVPFDIDRTHPGKEYESADNLYPMEPSAFADTLTEKVFPRYFLSDAYKDSLSDTLTEPAKDQNSFKTALRSQGIADSILSTLDERATVELTRLGEVVANQHINPDERVAKKLQLVRRIKQSNSFIYLGNKLGETQAQAILFALLQKHHAYKGLTAEANNDKKKILVDVGVPGLILNMLSSPAIDDLFKIREAIMTAKLDSRSGKFVLAIDINPELIRLGTVITQRQLSDTQTILWQTYHGSIFGPDHKKGADETRELASGASDRAKTLETLVDANVPRAYIEILPDATLYDLLKLKQKAASAPFDKSSANTAAAINQQEFGKLRTEFSSLLVPLRQTGELILAALVKNYHTASVLAEQQQYLADFADMMTSREDRARTGKSRVLDNNQLGSLNAPKSKEINGTEKSILSTQYWSNENAKKRLETNAFGKDGFFSEKNKAAMLKKPEQRIKIYNLVVTWATEKAGMSGEQLATFKTELGDNDVLDGYMGYLDKKDLLTLLPDNVKQNITDLQNLSDKEIGAIFKYTTAEFVPMVLAANSLGTKDFTESDVTDPNARKWSSEGGTGALSTLKYTNPAMKALISGLDKLSPYAGKVYRGEDSNQTLKGKTELERSQYAQQRFPVGKVDFRAYPMSSSTTEDAPKKAPGGDKFDIFYEISNVKTGKSIELLSNSPDEKEVLFAPGARFKITSTVTKNGGELWVYMVEI
jgi:hypothetical protein